MTTFPQRQEMTFMWEGVQWIQIANIMWLLSTTLLASSGVLCNSKHHMDCKHKHHWSAVQVQNEWFIRNWIHYWKWHSVMHSAFFFGGKHKCSKKCCRVSEMNFIGVSPFVSSESVNGLQS